MPNSKALAGLRAAILDEQIAHAEAKKVLDRYQTFTAKLIEFQTQGGPSPSKEEFARWRDDILLMWAVREEEVKAKSIAMAIEQPRKN